MPKLSDRLNSKKEKDIRVLSDFISIFCRENHPEAGKDAFIIRDERLALSLDIPSYLQSPHISCLKKEGN